MFFWFFGLGGRERLWWWDGGVVGGVGAIDWQSHWKGISGKESYRAIVQ